MQIFQKPLFVRFGAHKRVAYLLERGRVEDKVQED